MQGDDPENYWHLELRGDGESPGAQILMSMPFSETLVTKGPFNPEDFGRNVAVVGKLDNFAAFPQKFLPSERYRAGDEIRVRGVKNRVAIFFRTKQVVKMGGTLIVIAPEGFKFQTACAVEELEASYYAIQEPEQTVPVEASSCVGRLNEATITLSLRLFERQAYGFALTVTNPVDFKYGEQLVEGWRLWTLTPAGQYVDGAHSAAIMHAPDERSWGMYGDDFRNQLNITLATNPGGSLRPYVFACNRSTAIPRCPVEPTLAGTSRINVLWQVVRDTTTTLRFCAPKGFGWLIDVTTFRYRTVETNISVFEPVTNELPRGLPTVDGHCLTWARGAYKRYLIDGTPSIYGFSAPLIVPTTSPNTAGNAVTDQRGLITLEVETITPLPPDAGITFEGPVRIRAPCQVEDVGGTLPPDATAECPAGYLILKAGRNGLPPAHIRIQ